jgi:hypothetical protein
VALRPRLSPGVPLSSGGTTELRAGTGAVKLPGAGSTHGTDGELPHDLVTGTRQRQAGQCKLFEAACRLDLGGIVAKRKADSYHPETAWYKVRTRPTLRRRVGESYLKDAGEPKTALFGVRQEPILIGLSEHGAGNVRDRETSVRPPAGLR